MLNASIINIYILWYNTNIYILSFIIEVDRISMNFPNSTPNPTVAKHPGIIPK